MISILFLLNPAPLIGDSAQAQALKDYHLSKIRSALDLQEIQMSDDTLAQLTRSIANESEKHSLDPMLLMAIIEVESRFDQKAVSPQGALGLMQVQPIVVAALVEEGKISPADKNRKLNLKDPVVNVKVGASYLAHLKDLYAATAIRHQGPVRATQLGKSLRPPRHFEHGSKRLDYARPCARVTLSHEVKLLRFRRRNPFK